MYSLSYTSLTKIKNISAPTHLAGSSFYIHHKNKVIERTKKRKIAQDEGIIFRRYVEACTMVDYYNVGRNPDNVKNELLKGDYYADALINYRKYMDAFAISRTPIKRTYKLNKSKIRKKISAFCRLDQSNKFLAFYSISFPENASDSILYKIFNKWLTNCRTRYNLKSYVWVAERQENNTLHFHLLTNNWLDIKRVNSAMASAIDGEVNNGNLSWNNSSKERYNGIDVDSPQFPKKRQNENREAFRARKAKASRMSKNNTFQWIAKYLTKYVTKNDIEFNTLPYHSSRDVSRLFTTKVINDNHLINFSSYLPDDIDKYNVYENDRIEYLGFKFNPKDDLFNLIDTTNQRIYNNYQNNT